MHCRLSDCACYGATFMFVLSSASHPWNVFQTDRRDDCHVVDRYSSTILIKTTTPVDLRSVPRVFPKLEHLRLCCFDNEPSDIGLFKLDCWWISKSLFPKLLVVTFCCPHFKLQLDHLSTGLTCRLCTSAIRNRPWTSAEADRNVNISAGWCTVTIAGLWLRYNCTRCVCPCITTWVISSLLTCSDCWVHIVGIWATQDDNGVMAFTET